MVFSDIVTRSLGTGIIFVLLLLIIATIVILVKTYYKTQIIDFRYVIWYYMIIGMSIFIVLLTEITQLLFFYQLEQIGLVLNSYILLILFRRFFSDRKYVRYLYNLSLIFFAITVISIVFWKKFQQPEKLNYLNFNYFPLISLHHPQGAGLKINNQIIYTSSYPLFTDLLSMFILFISLIYFISYKPHFKYNKALIIKGLWIVFYVLLLIRIFLQLPYFGTPVNQITFNILGLLPMLILVSITLFFPQGFLISKEQIFYVQKIYSDMDEFDSNSDQDNFRISKSSIEEQMINYVQEAFKLIRKG